MTNEDRAAIAMISAGFWIALIFKERSESVLLFLTSCGLVLVGCLLLLWKKEKP